MARLTVHKWQLTMNVGDPVPIHVQLEEGARVVHVAEQNGWVTFWYECDPTKKKVARYFYSVGTGRDVPEGSKYVGTALLDEGRLVAHVYEK